MFREMRRARQAMPPEDCMQVLRRGTAGVLALLGDDGYPYAVPLSYVCHDGTLYFHSAPAGHKLDALARGEKASFCVIDQDVVVPEKLTTAYRSVIVFGRARIVRDDGARRAALAWLAGKYAPGREEENRREIEEEFGRVCVIALEIEHLSGKEGRELLRARDAANPPAGI